MRKIESHLKSIGIVILVSCMGLVIHKYIEPVNLVMLYLLAVVITAGLWGRGPAITASLVSVLVFDFLFVPPRFKMSVSDTQYLLTFIGLFVVGVIIGELGAQLRQRALEARKREEQTGILYRLSRDLTTTLQLADALDIIRNHIESVMRCKVRIFLPYNGALRRWQDGAWELLDDSEEPVVRGFIENVHPADSQTTPVPAMQSRYLPLKTANQTLGVISYNVGESRNAPGPDELVILDAMIHQCTMAIERIRLLEENRTMEILREKDRLYTLLLNSISHDLRTPLVAITGTLSSLMEDGDRMQESTFRELIETAYEESLRMNHIVGDLLDMTRIEAGALHITPDPCDVRDVISVSLDYVREKLGARIIRMDVEEGIPEVLCDMPLIVKALGNVLDNAIKYSPPDTPITISARNTEIGIEIAISDRGGGMPAEEMNHLFEKFYRGARSRSVPGLGLGLSICKGIVEAHKGSIRIGSDPHQGIIVVITLPGAD
jgi:two-component system sensor histidine kinase KdpD